MKNFLSVRDVSDVKKLIDEALLLKKNPLAHQNLGAGRPWVCYL